MTRLVDYLAAHMAPERWAELGAGTVRDRPSGEDVAVDADTRAADLLGAELLGLELVVHSADGEVRVAANDVVSIERDIAWVKAPWGSYGMVGGQPLAAAEAPAANAPAVAVAVAGAVVLHPFVRLELRRRPPC